MPPKDSVIEFHPKSGQNDEKEVSEVKSENKPSEVRLLIVVFKLNFWVSGVCHRNVSYYKAIGKESKKEN